MNNIQHDIEKMEAKLEQWGAKLDDLVAKADKSAKSASDKHIHQIKAKHAAARVKLDELKSASTDKWETLKGGMESAWGELETAFEKLKN